MKKPKLEAMIEDERVQLINIIYRRNSCYQYILAQIENLAPKSLLAGSELHSMVNYGLNEPIYIVS